MTVNEFFETITDPDRLRIIQQDEEIFVGFLGMLRLQQEMFDKIKDRTMIRFRAVPEITHRRCKELNLIKPIDPDKAQMFRFSDLQMKLYYTIYI